MKKTRSVFRPREEWITVPVPALIDEVTFYRVQEQLKKNRAFSRRNLKRKDEYLLRCLVQCGVCGRSMVAHSHGKHTYYHCSGSVDPISSQKPRRCPAPQVYAPDLDRIVWDEIKALLRSPASLRAAFESQRPSHRVQATDVIEAELERLEQRTVDARRQVQRLLDAYQKGLVRPSELARRWTSLEERIASWNRQRRQLEEQRPKLRETREVMHNLAAFSRHVGSGLKLLGFENKQKLLRKIIERVTVTAWEVRVKLAIPVLANSDLTTERVHHAEDAAPLLSPSS
jgi:site-specific DNA recombinase